MAATALYNAISEKIRIEQSGGAAAAASSDVQSKTEADYQKGKKEKAEGLTTVYTVEEFEQRFG